MNKAEILNEITNVKETEARNSMGCSESWYNPYFALNETFSMEQLSEMSETELNNLIKLAETIGEGLY